MERSAPDGRDAGSGPVYAIDELDKLDDELDKLTRGPSPSLPSVFPLNPGTSSKMTGGRSGRM
jgi:hypothetical protein